MPLTIRELPAAERPRERLRTHGAHALSSSELIAILLGSGSAARCASSPRNPSRPSQPLRA